VVGITIVKVRTVNESTGRNVNTRVPTAMAASDLVSGVYATLASLRGFLVTGSDGFKAERAVFWKEIQKRGSDMDRLSSQWTARVMETRPKCLMVAGFCTRPAAGDSVSLMTRPGSAWLRS